MGVKIMTECVYVRASNTGVRIIEHYKITF